MHISARLQRPPLIVFLQPQAFAHTFSDMMQKGPRHGLCFHKAAPVLRSYRKDQLEVFAVAKGVIQW